MYDFWTHAVLTIWSVIFTIIGWGLLLIIFGFATNWIFVTVTNRINNRDNEEELS